MTARRKRLRPADFGPRERHRRPGAVGLERGGSRGLRARVRTQDALDRYFRTGRLDPGDRAGNRRRYEAGRRLQADWLAAGMEAPTTAGYSDQVDGGRPQDLPLRRLDAYRRWRAAIQAVGPIAAREVIEVCCVGSAVGRTGLEILRRGLALLADHYDAAEGGAEGERPARRA